MNKTAGPTTGLRGVLIPSHAAIAQPASHYIAEMVEAIPERVLAHDVEAMNIEKTLLDLPIIGEAQLSVQVPDATSFLALSSRGLFAYDWTDIRRTHAEASRAYELVSLQAQVSVSKTCPSHYRRSPATLVPCLEMPLSLSGQKRQLWIERHLRVRGGSLLKKEQTRRDICFLRVNLGDRMSGMSDNKLIHSLSYLGSRMLSSYRTKKRKEANLIAWRQGG